MSFDDDLHGTAIFCHAVTSLLAAGARMMTPGGRVTGPVGQQVQLTCEAEGDPPLSLSWTRLGTPVVNSDRLGLRRPDNMDAG